VTTYPELKKRYIDSGKVRFIFREFPLDQLAAAGSMLARCADKNRYFDIVEMLFHQQQQWVTPKPLPPLFNLVKQVGFTEQTFNACLTNQKLLDELSEARDRATNKFGVDSTPTFFINGEKHPGALSIDEMAKLIDPYLKA
jgi:protein-disulfide isomerase